MSALAEALLLAHQDRLQGWVTCTRDGRRSRLGFRDGELVAVDLEFAHRSTAQALLAASRLSLEQLDALWARGEAPDAEPETLAELGLTAAEAEAERVCASVRALVVESEAVRFEAELVPGGVAVPGARVVRAAFEADPTPPPGPLRLAHPERLAAWGLSQEEQAWLSGLEVGAAPEALPLARRGLLALLARVGALAPAALPGEAPRRRLTLPPDLAAPGPVEAGLVRAREEAEAESRREDEEHAARRGLLRPEPPDEPTPRVSEPRRLRDDPDRLARLEAAMRQAEQDAEAEEAELERERVEVEARLQAERAAHERATAEALARQERAMREAEEQARRSEEAEEAQASADRQREASAQLEAEAQRQAAAQAEAEREAQRQAVAQADAERESLLRLEAEREAAAQRQAAEQAEAEREAEAQRQAAEQAEAEFEAEAQRRAEAQAEAERNALARLEAEARWQAAAQAEAARHAEAEQEAAAHAEAARQAEAERHAAAQAEAQRRPSQIRMSPAAEARARAEASRLRAEVEARRAEDSRRPTPVPTPAVPDGRAAADQNPSRPRRGRSSLVERLNEAVRRSAYTGPEEPQPPPLGAREERTDPELAAMPDAIPSAPRPPSGPQEDGDLWSLVQPAQQVRRETRGSFEEAFDRVDTSLEALLATEAGSTPLIEADVIEVGPAVRAPTPAPAETPVDPEESRLRRQRLLRRAMGSVGGMPSSPSGVTPAPAALAPSPPAAAASPSGVVVVSGSSVTSSPSRSGSGRSGTSPSAFPASPSGLSAVSVTGSRSGPTSPSSGRGASIPDQQLAVQIEARFEQVRKRDYFGTLGLSPDATRDQVKVAYLGLAKVFHPDRLPPALAHLAGKLSTVYESIREAYDTLHDEARRGAWLAGRTATTGVQSASPFQQASELTKMGEAYFKKRDYRQAEDHFARAHALDRSAGSLAAQAWAIYMDPSRKGEGPAARGMMQRAIDLDASCDRAHYQLGVIARVEGDMDRAEKHFREAVRVNPRHLEANQELRLIEMRRRKGGGRSG